MSDLLVYLNGIGHRLKRGHWPDYIQLAKGFGPTCIRCVKGGHRQPLFVPVRVPLRLGI